MRAGGLWSGLTVGLLGGSFNPAHAGHRHVSLAALRHLGLDQVWWLVTPQNPLKGTADTAPLRMRIERARMMARHPRICVTALEQDLGTRYTADTLVHLVRRFPRTRFVWLMGADLLPELPRWQRWSSILHTVPIAIFDRAPYGLKGPFGHVGQRFARARRRPWQTRRLASAEPPAWVVCRVRRHPASATALRHAAAESVQTS